MGRPSLTDADLAMFQRLKIPPELLEAAQVERVTDREARDRYGIIGQGDMTGIAFPYFDPTTRYRTTARLRRDHPDFEQGKPEKKYISAYGDKKHLYFPPGARELLAESRVSVIIVEAEKSALAGRAWAQRANRPTLFIGTGGCWGWRGRTGKAESANGNRVDQKGPLPDLDLIAWQDRDVVILFDSNATTNFAVRRARFELAQELMSRGAKVRLGDLPAIDKVNGPDDLLAECGDWSISSLLEIAGPFAQVAVAEAEAAVIELETNTEARLHGDPKQTFVVLAAVDDLEQRELLIGRAARAFGRLLPKGVIRNAVEELRQKRSHACEKVAEESRRSSLRKLKVVPMELVTEVETFFTERAYLPAGAGLVLALWSMNTWTFESFDTVPFLSLESAVPACGKSTVLERLLGAVCVRPQMTANMTEATFFRIIDKLRPTLLVDEAELLEGRSEKADSLREIAHAGYKKGGKVPRCEGDEHEVRWFDVFCPQAYAAIGGLSGPLLDRAIVIHMERAPRKGNHRKSTKLKAVTQAAAPLREKLEAYSLQVADVLAELYDSAPDEGCWPGIRDREAELWEPLLFHARLAGPNTEARLLAEVSRFSSQKARIQEDDSRVAQVVALLEAVTAHTGDIFTPADLVEELTKSEAWAKTFANYKSGDDGKKAKAAAVGRLLAKFRMVSRKPTSFGITYSTAEAIAKLSAHLPADSLNSFIRAPQETSTGEDFGNTGFDSTEGSCGSDERCYGSEVEDQQKPNGRADGWLEFEI